MKNSVLSLEQMIEWKRQMDNGSSLPIFTDSQSGKSYVPKLVTEYKSGFFTDLENGDVLKSDQDKKAGICSISKNQLPSGKNQLVFAICVKAKSLAASTEAALLASAFDGVAPAYFLNGEVRANQNAELLRTTGDLVHNIYASTGNGDNFLQVAPFTIRETTDFNFNFKLAGTAVANDAYKLLWQAIEFVEVAKA